MKIAINCRSFLKPNFTGIGRYAHNLVHHLSQISQTHQYFLYAPIGLFDRKRKPPYIGKNNFFTKVDRFGRGPSKVLKNFDIYHSPSPDMIEEMDSKIIVTVHDLVYKAFPQGHTEETLRLTDEQFKNFLPRVSRLLCTSKNTAKDLKKYFQVDDSKIRIIYSGVDKKAFYPVTAEEVPAMQKTIINKGINEEFILYVGTIEPRKNLDNLLKAFVQLKQEQRFDGKLVIAGMKGWKSQSFEDNLKKFGIHNDVVILGFLSNEELRHFYAACEVFVFPSFYEGFGFPILEAFNCGAAVITSNVSSCPELAGTAALTIDPNDIQQMKDSIITVLNDLELRENLKARGLKRAGEFSFQRTAEETLKVYEEVYNGC